VDLFSSYHVNGWFALEKAVRGRLPREALLPLGEVELEGKRFPAPHDPGALLALTYGESWRVPDPSFTYHFPPAVKQRTEGWFGVRLDRVRWREAARSSRRGQREPSAFARVVDEQLTEGTTVVDIGCGLGADAVWLARDGRRVLGLDYVPDALRPARNHAKHTPSARFELLNLNDLRQVLATGTRTALDEPAVSLYARHLLDSLLPTGRANLWVLAKILLGGGGTMFLQFQTRLAADGSVQHVRSPLRRSHDPEEVVAEVIRRGGRVLAREELDEDGRRVCRLSVGFGAGGELSP
jgi:SAM-dependent methyltransferase